MKDRPRDQLVVVTGATGLFGWPLCIKLASTNEVVAVARFGDPALVEELTARGVTCVPFDLASDDLAVLPAHADTVFHLGATTMVAGSGGKEQANLLDVNVQATGRLFSRYRDASAFVVASSGAVYAFQGERPLQEADPYGLLNGLEDYSLSKIAAEQLVQFLSREWQTPTTILRIVGLYGPRGGLLTLRIDRVRAGEAVAVYPGVTNTTTAMYQDDYVEKAILAAAVADVPPRIINFTGTEPVTVDECCRLVGQQLGTAARIEPSPDTFQPVLLDTTRMEALLGPTSISPSVGIARVLEAGGDARLDAWSSWRTAAPGSVVDHPS